MNPTNSENPGLDRQQGLSSQERQYLKDQEMDNVYKDIQDKGHRLIDEIMKNVHNENMGKINDRMLSGIGLSTKKIEDVLKANSDIWSRYSRYNRTADGRLLKASDKGIAMIQALAEACVEGLQNIQVKGTLKSTQYFTAKKDIDGYMGPNTTLLLEKIAETDLGNGPLILSFDGTITPELILKMYASCHPDETKTFVSQNIAPDAKYNEKLSPEQLSEKKVKLMQSIQTLEDELWLPGKNTGNLFALNELYEEYLRIATPEEIASRLDALKNEKTQYETGKDRLSDQIKTHKKGSKEYEDLYKNIAITQAHINYLDAIINKFLAAAEKNPITPSSQQEQPVAEQQLETPIEDSPAEKQFLSLLTDTNINLTPKHFAVWHDIITDALEDHFILWENESLRLGWKAFFAGFAAMLLDGKDPLLDLVMVGANGDIILKKHMEDQAKTRIAGSLAQYFVDNKDKYSPDEKQFIIYQLDHLWDEEGLPYQPNLISGNDPTYFNETYPTLMSLYQKTPAKALGLTPEQKAKLTRPADVIRFYNKQVERYHNKSN